MASLPGLDRRRGAARGRPGCAAGWTGAGTSTSAPVAADAHAAGPPPRSANATGRQRQGTGDRADRYGPAQRGGGREHGERRGGRHRHEQARTRRAPVATPLPPSNRSQTGYMCPTTEPSAASAARSGRPGKRTPARATAAAPLPASHSQGEEPRRLAGAARHVRRADVARAHPAHVGDAERARDDEAERDRADGVGEGGDREDGDHPPLVYRRRPGGTARAGCTGRRRAGQLAAEEDERIDAREAEVRFGQVRPPVPLAPAAEGQVRRERRGPPRRTRPPPPPLARGLQVQSPGPAAQGRARGRAGSPARGTCRGRRRGRRTAGSARRRGASGPRIASTCAGDVCPRKRSVRWAPSGRARRIEPRRGPQAAPAARRSPRAPAPAARGRQRRGRPCRVTAGRGRGGHGGASRARPASPGGARARARRGTRRASRACRRRRRSRRTRGRRASRACRRPGPAIPVMPTPTSTPAARRAPSAIAAATSRDTAPWRSRRAASRPSSSTFARFA